MPAKYWLPMRLPAGVTPQAHHLHAAISTWFDSPKASGENGPRPAGHDDTTKAWTAAWITDRQRLEVSVLTDEAERRLVNHAATSATIRLGTAQVPIGDPIHLKSATWNELASPTTSRAWRVDFLTPATFGRDNRTLMSPFPDPQDLLNVPRMAWATFNPSVGIELSAADKQLVWVAHVELETVKTPLIIHGKPTTLPGCRGSVTYRCDNPDVAHRVAALLRLAQFSGVGARTRFGLGAVNIQELP